MRNDNKNAGLDLLAEDLQDLVVSLSYRQRSVLAALHDNNCIDLITESLLHELGFNELLNLIISECDLCVPHANCINEIQSNWWSSGDFIDAESLC